MNRKYNILNTLISLTLVSTLFSCQKSSQENLKEAQLCLNNSAASEARACLDKISSDTSAQAYKLRCAAVFISEGFNSPTSFTSALDQLNGSGSCSGGCSSTVDTMNVFNFHSGNNTDATNRQRNLDVSEEAFNYCSAAETNIYMQISSIFRIGTLLSMTAYAATGGTTPTIDQMKSSISSLPASDVGAIVVTTYQTTCSDLTTASDATKKYCTELGVAVNAGGSQTQIGDCLKNKLSNPSYTCP